MQRARRARAGVGTGVGQPDGSAACWEQPGKAARREGRGSCRFIQARPKSRDPPKDPEWERPDHRAGKTIN